MGGLFQEVRRCTQIGTAEGGRSNATKKHDFLSPLFARHSPISSLRVAKDGSIVIIAASDAKTVKVWEIVDGRPKKLPNIEYGDFDDQGKLCHTAQSVAISPDEKVFCLGGHVAAIHRLWKMFDVSDKIQDALNDNVEAAGKLKEAGLALLKGEADKLWDKESSELMKDLDATKEDLELEPTDAEGTNKALKALVATIKKDASKLQKEVEGLWNRFRVSEDAQLRFMAKLEEDRKANPLTMTMLKVEADRLFDMQSEKTMHEIGITAADINYGKTNYAEVQIKPKGGLRCSAQRDGEAKYKPGVIDYVNSDGSVDVIFDSDGVEIEHILMDSVKVSERGAK